MKLVDIVQFIWYHRAIPEDLGWTILILIPKVNTDNLWIGLLGVIWKLMEAIIDTHINNSVTFHDVLHGFRVGMLMGTAIMELNLAQELVSVDQDPLLLVFLDILKAY